MVQYLILQKILGFSFTYMVKNFKQHKHYKMKGESLFIPPQAYYCNQC